MPDWRDPAAYEPLLDADRSLFAWEWLRRDRRYRAAAGAPHGSSSPGLPVSSAGQFGLVAFESAALAVPHARPMWRVGDHRFVLCTEAGHSAFAGDHIAIDRLGGLAQLIQTNADHLLLSDGLRAVRLDAPLGTFTRQLVSLRYLIDGLVSAEPALLTLRRFLAICRAGQFSRSLHRREPRARRWILMLRAYDAVAAGATHREVAERLLSRSVIAPRWRSREPSVRSQAQRLVRAASALADGGYRALLR